MIAQPLEFVPAEPFLDFLTRLKEIIRDKEVELLLVGRPRNMDGIYGPAALKVQEFVAVLKDKLAIPIQLWDERLISAQAQRFLIQGQRSPFGAKMNKLPEILSDENGRKVERAAGTESIGSSNQQHLRIRLLEAKRVSSVTDGGRAPRSSLHGSD